MTSPSIVGPRAGVSALGTGASSSRRLALLRALSLAEREPAPPWTESPNQRDAVERADQWCTASGLDEDLFASVRLAAAGWTRDDFVAMLADQAKGAPPTVGEAADLEWLGIVEAIERGVADGVALPTAQWTMPDGTKTDEPPFSSFIRPFLELGFDRLRAGAAAAGDAVEQDLSPGVELKLHLDLVERLVKRCSGTLILELNIARLEGRLEGATSGERFRHFAERSFDRRKLLAVLDEVPVLARSMATAVLQWCAATLEMLQRLASDRSDLGPLLADEGSDAKKAELGRLVDLELGISDPHRGGRGVAVLIDADGRRVVYKPTSLTADVRLHDFFTALAACGLRHPLRAVPALDRGSYGWQRYIEAVPCRSVDELQRFFWRQGALIAVLHLLRGADVHHENLIAHGEWPILVDNEALFQHARPLPLTSAGRRAVLTMGRSVLRQALLPFVHRLTSQGSGVDSSGLGGAGGQVAAGSVRRWTDPGLDTMRVEAADYVSPEASNRPRLDGRTVDASPYRGHILRGFRETYDLIARHRERLLPPLEAFAGVSVRYLVRPTRIYSVFLREARHPNDLGDGLDRDQLFDRLWSLARPWPALLRVVPHEQRDLWQGDVPAFTARPESTALWTSRGERIDSFFAAPSLDDATRLLREMGPRDREHQALLIRLSLDEASARTVGEPPPHLASPLNHALAVVEDESAEGEMLQALRQVVAQLKKREVVEDGHAFWIGLDPFVDDTPGAERARNVALAGGDLYHGAAGIAITLAWVGATLGDDEAVELAHAAARAMAEARAATDPSRGPSQPMMPVLGAFLGRGAFAYAALHLATLWDDAVWLDEALADLEVVERLIDADDDLDLLTGSAGYIPVALALHRRTGSPRALQVARRCGQHLLARSVAVDGGLGWIGRSFPGPVAGFAHGQAGIAWALAELAAATGEERFRAAAWAGIEAERALLETPDGQSFHRLTSWCHGLPSVGLGRLLVAPHLEPSQRARADEEVRRGVGALLAAGPPDDACLCHGVLGNAEILDLAGRRLEVEAWCRTAQSWRLLAARRAAALADETSRLPLHGRFAGLMTGLAGLAWGLLRGVRGDAVPSVLALELPPAS